VGVNNLFKPRKHFRGGGYDAGAGGAKASGFDGSEGSMGSSTPSGPSGQGNFGQNNPNFGGNNNNNQQQQQVKEEEKPGFLDGVANFFSGLAPTEEEQFGNQWNLLPSRKKKELLGQLDFDPTNMTPEALDAFSAASNMSWEDIKERTSNISMENFTSLPGFVGAGYSMFDAMNPFTDTQYHLQDPTNWSSTGPAGIYSTYTGNIASLNSAQLAEVEAKQLGGLNQTQLGQTLAQAIADSETDAAGRGRGPDPTEEILNDEDQATADAQALYDDLISRGFSESMAKRMLENGNYFASYDSV
tara:strand:+ start:1764 stop:2666 length:903 start_codon:yes stop_codon:yes gene_type:complete